MKKLLWPILLGGLLTACTDHDQSGVTAVLATAAPTVPTAATANTAVTPAAPPDYRQYAQYVWCRINGQPYLAYSAPGHTTGITNAANQPSRADFATSADDVQLNGATEGQELHLVLFNLAQKGPGEYRSPTDFALDGHTGIVLGGTLKYVSFAAPAGQVLTISRLKDGVVEGTFGLNVADEQDPKHLLKLTDGHFRLALNGGIKQLKTDAAGDADLAQLIKDVTK